MLETLKDIALFLTLTEEEIAEHLPECEELYSVLNERLVDDTTTSEDVLKYLFKKYLD